MQSVQDQTHYDEFDETQFWDDILLGRLETPNTGRTRMLIHGVDFDMNSGRALDLPEVDEVYETEVKPDSWHLAPKNSDTVSYMMRGQDWRRTSKSPAEFTRNAMDPDFDVQVYNMEHGSAQEVVNQGVEYELVSDNSHSTVVYMAPNDSDCSLPEIEGETYKFESGAEALITQLYSE
jgi:hypothetical protein